ncbi:MAG: phenylalanine--tRNA ligase subunit beta [Candidatus Pacearchaeota archaeon]|nr:phenylalanine--tRNA ligase subunit beta [Candidatus Pacearchaeota archaeon]
MPNIEINKKDFEHLLGRKFSQKDLENVFEFTKVGIEKVENDKITLEIKDSNRLDLLSIEGVVREVKGIIKKEIGLKDYKIEKSNFVVKVDHKVKAVRPFTVCAVIKDLKFTEHFIEQMIQLQEKLCEGFGKKRRDVALGIYDFDKIKWPITYTTFKPDALGFIPLGFEEKLTLRQILERHEKGQIYGGLLHGAKEYPIFIDKEQNVLSMPPIINSEYSGKVTNETKNVFIEVSGFDMKKISYALNIVVAAFADRGGKIFQVNVRNLKSILIPNFYSRVKKVTLEEINALLGLGLSDKDVIYCLKKARYGVKQKGNEFIVDIPFYREDVLHKVDIIEDIAIAHGFKNIEPVELKIPTTGTLLNETNKQEKLSSLLIGLEFQEVLTLNLSKKSDLFEMMNLPISEIVEIKNPVSENQNCIRNWLMPSLLNFLSQNTTKIMPQKIFEIGKSFEVDNLESNKTKEKTKVAFAISEARANFTQIKQVLDYLADLLGVKYSLKQLNHGSFISGRCAEIIILEKDIKGRNAERVLGIIGEVNPKVLSNWKIKMPVAAMELDFDLIKEF